MKSPVRASTLLLVALSGVRVRDKELLALGMTLPGFVDRGKVIASLPSLGLITLAAHMPEHWNIEYLELDQVANYDIQTIVKRQPDLIAFSALTARIETAYALADKLRGEGLCVVAGGLHVSAVPNEAALHFASIVVGEGETAWPQLIADFEAGSLQPVYRSTEIDRSGFAFENSRCPRYDLLPLSQYNRITFQTTRGCPFDCSFCAASRTISRFKTKPIDLVRRDLEAILTRWPSAFIELADDNTFVHKSWSRDLAKLLGEYPVLWFTETDISVADDLQLLESLAASGCRQLLIGLESVNPGSLRDLDRANWKYGRYENYIKQITTIQSYGISVNGCFTLGLDADDENIFQTTLDFVRDSELSEVQITVLTPFPGTSLYTQLAAQGRLLKPRYWNECTLFDVTYQPAKMSVEQLRSGFRWLMSELYSPAETARRRAKFNRIIRQAIKQPSAEKK